MFIIKGSEMAIKEHTFQDRALLLSILDREVINGLVGNKKMLKKALDYQIPQGVLQNWKMNSRLQTAALQVVRGVTLEMQCHITTMRLCTPIKSYGFVACLNLRA